MKVKTIKLLGDNIAEYLKGSKWFIKKSQKALNIKGKLTTPKLSRQPQEPLQTCFLHPALRWAQENGSQPCHPAVSWREWLGAFSSHWQGCLPWMPKSLLLWQGKPAGGGMIFGGLLCIAGILIAMNRKCKYKYNQKDSPLPEKATPLITPGSASTCWAQGQLCGTLGTSSNAVLSPLGGFTLHDGLSLQGWAFRLPSDQEAVLKISLKSVKRQYKKKRHRIEDFCNL